MTWMVSQMPITTFMLCSTSRIVSFELVAQPADQAHQLERLLRIHAGRRLVEQQQLRLGRQRARDLEPALAAVRQAGRRLVGHRVELEDLEQLHRAVARLALFSVMTSRVPSTASAQRLPVAGGAPS